MLYEVITPGSEEDLLADLHDQAEDEEQHELVEPAVPVAHLHVEPRQAEPDPHERVEEVVLPRRVHAGGEAVARLELHGPAGRQAHGLGHAVGVAVRGRPALYGVVLGTRQAPGTCSVWLHGLRDRITSYNVCYTKLLRLTFT